jgi:hypothetical protein
LKGSSIGPSGPDRINPELRISMRALVAIAAIVLMAYGYLTATAGSSDPKTTASVRTQQGTPADSGLFDAVSVARTDWRRDNLGFIAIADVTVRNNNRFPVRVDRIACRLRDQGGKIDERVQTVYGVIPPRGAKEFRDVGFGFADNELEGRDCVVRAAERN